MNVNVKYDNAHYGDHEKYATTLADLLDTFNGIIDQVKLVANLRNEGIAIIHNGYATTTVTLIERG